MRKKRRERLSEFGTDERGKLAYLGEHVRLASGTDRRALIAALWVPFAVAAVATVVPAALNPRGFAGCPYVLLPYVAQLMLLVSVAWALARFTVAGERVRAYVRDETAGSLPGRCAAGAVCALVTFVGEVVLLALTAEAPGPVELVLFVGELASAAALLALRRSAAAIAWEPC